MAFENLISIRFWWYVLWTSMIAAGLISILFGPLQPIAAAILFPGIMVWQIYHAVTDDYDTVARTSTKY